MADSPVVGALIRLRGELLDDRQVLARVSDRMSARLDELVETTLGAEQLAWIAVQIHRWYTGLEASLARAERSFGAMPTGAEWHTELLRGATLDLEGLRPPILPASTLVPLRELLGFRHFFRCAYAVDLDGALLLANARTLTSVAPAVDEALARFIEHLADMVAALRDG